MKRVRADELIRRLRDRFAPGGLAALRPGQVVSRRADAALGLCAVLAPRRRADLARRRADRARNARRKKPSRDDAQRFAEGIAAGVGIMADYVQPAYEDPADRMLKLGLIPDNVDPSDPKIDDPLERARILRLFDDHARRGRRVSSCRCSAGPRKAKPGWLSEMWRTRREQIVFGAGRFAARLPAAAAIAAAYLAPVDYPHLVPADPFAERRPLSDPGLPIRRRRAAAAGAARQEAAPPLAPEALVMQRPAACERRRRQRCRCARR